MDGLAKGPEEVWEGGSAEMSNAACSGKSSPRSSAESICHRDDPYFNISVLNHRGGGGGFSFLLCHCIFEQS